MIPHFRLVILVIQLRILHHPDQPHILRAEATLTLTVADMFRKAMVAVIVVEAVNIPHCRMIQAVLMEMAAVAAAAAAAVEIKDHHCHQYLVIYSVVDPVDRQEAVL